MIRFRFVDDHRDTHEVKRMCTVLGIHRSSYYKWRAGKAARLARQQADAALVDRIRAHHQEWDHTLGYRRMTAELADDDAVPGTVNHKRVARL
ncbi:integrase, partial [Rhodococcus pyridinivorans KG-16]